MRDRDRLTDGMTPDAYFTSRRTLLGLAGAVPLSLIQTQAGDPVHGADRSCAAPGGHGDGVRVTDFGAQGDGMADDSDAVDAAIVAAETLGQPVCFPPGTYLLSRPHLFPTGIIGLDSASTILRLDERARRRFDIDPALGNRQLAAVRIGRRSGEISADRRYDVPVRGFSVQGLSRRTPRRSGDRASQGFGGIGILFDELAGFVHMVDIRVAFFDKGIVFDNNTGHIGGTALQVSNCWYNLYWEAASDDFRFFDCVFAGALFASYGCHGTRKGGVRTGGIGGLTLIGCHAGFAPYGFYQEDGDGTLGLVHVTMINSSFEQIGNRVIHLGAQTSGLLRVSGAISVTGAGHSWTGLVKDRASFDAYTIQEDPRHPVQDYAICEIQLLQAGALRIGIDGFRAGTSGYACRIRNLLDFVWDDRGTDLYEVIEQGRERLVGDGRGFAASVPVTTVDRAHGDVRLASFDLPHTLDGMTRGMVGWHLNADNHGGTPLLIKVALSFNGAVQPPLRIVTLAPGRSDIDGRMSFDLPRRDRKRGVFTVAIHLLQLTDTVVLGGPGLPGEASIEVLASVGVV